jgi:hypothetical protein
MHRAFGGSPRPGELIQLNAVGFTGCLIFKMGGIHRLPDKWLPVSIAPSDIDLEVGVTDKHDVVALVFPVRKKGIDWIHAATREIPLTLRRRTGVCGR